MTQHLSQKIYYLNNHTTTQSQFEDDMLQLEDTNISSYEDTPDKYTEDLSMKNDLEDVLYSLTPRESKVLKMRFGIDMNGGNAVDGNGYSLEEVGKQFDVTQERIRQIEAKALRKLRHKSRAIGIKQYWENN